MDKLIWWADSQDKPQMELYNDLAVLLSKAKVRITGKEDLNEGVKEYSDDEDENEPLNIALKKTTRT